MGRIRRVLMRTKTEGNSEEESDQGITSPEVQFRIKLTPFIDAFNKFNYEPFDDENNKSQALAK